KRKVRPLRVQLEKAPAASVLLAHRSRASEPKLSLRRSEKEWRSSEYSSPGQAKGARTWAVRSAGACARSFPRSKSYSRPRLLRETPGPDVCKRGCVAPSTQFYV